jgi:serine O-acetyltransferase
LNPSLAAALIFRISARSSGAKHQLARWLSLMLFSSDVSTGAQLGVPIEVPHPLGIVIGSGVVTGERVRIFQNVTLGSSRSGAYPFVEDDVTIYAGAVVAGRITIGVGATVGANSLVTRSVAPGDTLRAGQ